MSLVDVLYQSFVLKLTYPLLTVWKTCIKNYHRHPSFWLSHRVTESGIDPQCSKCTTPSPQFVYFPWIHQMHDRSISMHSRSGVEQVSTRFCAFPSHAHSRHTTRSICNTSKQKLPSYMLSFAQLIGLVPFQHSSGVLLFLRDLRVQRLLPDGHCVLTVNFIGLWNVFIT